MPHVDLLELPYFEGIAVDALVCLIDQMPPRQYAAGSVMLDEDDTEPPPLLVVTHGQIRVSKHGPHGNATLADVAGPTVLGEIELFLGGPPVATARAVTLVSAFALTRETFARLRQEDGAGIRQFMLNVGRVACARLARADVLLAEK